MSITCCEDLALSIIQQQTKLSRLLLFALVLPLAYVLTALVPQDLYASYATCALVYSPFATLTRGQLPCLLSATKRTNGDKPISSTYNRVDKISYRFFRPMSSEPDNYGPGERKYFWHGEKTFPYRGALGKIRRSIHSYKYDKWGFLLYRCDYSSDDLWAKFLAALQKEVDDALISLDAEDLRSSLDMTPKEDKDMLDGATVERVRDIFTAWLGSDEAKAEFGGSTPRYMYCVHVDADVLDSVVNRAPKLPWSEARQVAYVNLVRPDTEWPPIPPDQLQYFTEEELDEELNEDIDVVKIPLDYLGPCGYDELYDAEMFDFYRLHPEV